MSFTGAFATAAGSAAPQGPFAATSFGGIMGEAGMANAPARDASLRLDAKQESAAVKTTKISALAMVANLALGGFAPALTQVPVSAARASFNQTAALPALSVRNAKADPIADIQAALRQRPVKIDGDRLLVRTADAGALNRQVQDTGKLVTKANAAMQGLTYGAKPNAGIGGSFARAAHTLAPLTAVLLPGSGMGLALSAAGETSGLYSTFGAHARAEAPVLGYSTYAAAQPGILRASEGLQSRIAITSGALRDDMSASFIKPGMAGQLAVLGMSTRKTAETIGKIQKDGIAISYADAAARLASGEAKPYQMVVKPQSVLLRQFG